MIKLDEIETLRRLLKWKLNEIGTSRGEDDMLTILSLKLLESLTCVAEDAILEDMKDQSEKVAIMGTPTINKINIYGFDGVVKSLIKFEDEPEVDWLSDKKIK